MNAGQSVRKLSYSLLSLLCVTLVCSCGEVPEQECFSPKNPKQSMPLEGGCNCSAGEPDQVVGSVRYQCRPVWGAELSQWFAVSESRPSDR